MGITARLAAFATSPLAGAEDARAVMRLSLLDWAAVGMAGRDEPVARILRDRAEAEGGRGSASVFGSVLRLPAQAAAMVNGATSHALDYDDTHFAHIGHPSVAVIPAVLALGEKTGADAAAMLDAALVGAEASVRFGVWLGRAHYQAGFHQTGTAGAIGATVGAARLLNLSPERAAHALGLVATRASGLKSQFGTMGKPLNAGFAASNGVEAAELAAAGFVSRPDGLECAQGFGPTHHGEADAHALDGIGQDWLFTGVSHKFHACCHGLHAMLEALAEKGGAGAPHLSPPSAIEVETNPRWLSVCNIAAPVTGLEAKFSYRLTAAMALTGRDTGALDSFTDDLAADPDLVALRDKVTVSGDPTLTEMQARVRLRLANGKEEVLFHDLDKVLPLETRGARVGGKVAALLGAARAEALWAAIQAPELDPLTALLRAG